MKACVSSRPNIHVSRQTSISDCRRTFHPIAFILTILAVSGGSALASREVRPEQVGNSAALAYPDQPYARNIWDMEVYDDRLYFGSGNSANTGPSQNAGPAPVVSFDGSRFRTEFLTSEEQVAVFREIDGELYIPGHDPRPPDGLDLGNYYRYVCATKCDWVKFRNIPQGLHAYDVREYRGALVVSGGSANQPISAWVSRDGGKTWDAAGLLTNSDYATPDNPSGTFSGYAPAGSRLWSLFELGGELYASGGAILVPTAGSTLRAATLFRFDADEGGFHPVSVVPAEQAAGGRDVFEAVNIDLFPDFEETGEAEVLPELFGGMTIFIPDFSRVPRIGIVQRATNIGESTVYIGATVYNDHQWIPFGLYAATGPDDIHSIPLPGGYQPYDILPMAGDVYVLTNRRESNGKYQVGVFRSSGDDLREWQLLFTFRAPTFARSFEYYRDSFYFGLGTEVSNPELEGAEAEQVWAAELSSAAGDVLRVRGSVVLQKPVENRNRK